MPLPPSLATKQVHAKFTLIDGTPASGSVIFDSSPYTLRVQADDTIIPVGTIVGALDGAGECTVTLPATDDPDVSPVGWAYTVRELILGRSERSYQIQIAHDAPALVHLADLIPTVPAPTLGAYVTQGDLEAAVDAAMASSPELADAIDTRLALQKGAANGIASLDASSTIPDAQIPATIARDAEVTAAVDALAPSAWADIGGTYVNNYAANANSTYYTPQFRTLGLDHDWVQLKGFFVKTTGTPTVGENIVTAIPTAMRPAKEVKIVTATDNDDNGAIRITPAGSVILASGFANTEVWLDGCGYYKGA